MKEQTPYDPQPELDDAFAQLSREGFDAVPSARHGQRLRRLRTASRESAISERRGGRRPRLAVAAVAAIAVLLVIAGLAYVNATREKSAPLAKTDPTQESAVPDATPTPEVAEPGVPFDSVAHDDPAWRTQAEAPRAAAPKGEVEDAPPANVIAEVEVDNPPAPAREAEARPAGSQSEPTTAARRVADTARARTSLRPAVAEGKLTDAETSVAETSEPRGDTAIDLATAAAAADEKEPRTFRMERSGNVELKRYSGQVVDRDLRPLVGAKVFVEGREDTVLTRSDGEFVLERADDQLTVGVLYPLREPVAVELKPSEEYRVVLPSLSLSAPSVLRQRGQQEVPTLAPLAEPNDDFEAYLSQRIGSDSADVTVVRMAFSVNRRGEVKSVSPAGLPVDKDLQRAAKALLLASPLWPEEFRRRRWRYDVRVGKQ